MTKQLSAAKIDHYRNFSIEQKGDETENLAKKGLNLVLSRSTSTKRVKISSNEVEHKEEEQKAIS